MLPNITSSIVMIFSRYAFVSIFFFSIISCGNQNNDQRQSTPENEWMAYGKKINKGSSVGVNEMMTLLEEQDSAAVKVQGEIVSTCKKKGCWMKIALPNGEEMRVAFKDYGFFVPKEDMEGKTAIMQGWVNKKIISEDQRRHYAQDGGQPEHVVASITGDKNEITFVAEGVLINN